MLHNYYMLCCNTRSGEFAYRNHANIYIILNICPCNRFLSSYSILNRFDFFALCNCHQLGRKFKKNSGGGVLDFGTDFLIACACEDGALCKFVIF